MSKRSLLIGITLSLFLASCVSIMKGTKQTVTINSNVDGADVYLEGQRIGETPFVGKIKKNKEAVTIKKNGYRTHTLSFSKSLEPLFWGNIITGGTLGSITDFATGAAYTYSPSSYQVELYKKGEETATFLNRYELRRYALLNMTEIAIDIGNGGGNYLETIITLAGLQNNQESIDVIRAKFNASNGNEIEFGNEVVKLLEV